MVHFIHAADIHLDSPLLGLSNDIDPTLLHKIRSACRQSFIELVDFTIASQCNLLLISGDLYDGSWKDYSTGLFFVQQMHRLSSHKIRVALVRGNHDAENKMSNHLALPDNVKLFSSHSAETWLLEDLGVAIHAQSYARPDIQENLAINYPPPIDNMINIGILHTLVKGGKGEHQPYAPCSLDDLIIKGYNYWALGHVHQFQVLSEKPAIIYPGCIQGRHIKETGEKGCVVVKGDESALQYEFKSLGQLRWYHLHIDANNLTSLEQLIKKTKAQVLSEVPVDTNKVTCLRLSYTGGCSLHTQLTANPAELEANCLAMLYETIGTNLVLEKVAIHTHALRDLSLIRAEDTPEGALLRLLDDLEENDLNTAFKTEFSSLKSAMMKEGIPVNMNDQILFKVKEMLLNELAHIQESED